MNPSANAAAVADATAYAAAVRAHLGDLSAEEVEELTGGLDADLSELAAESSTPLAERLGEPGAYAAELRTSAGLPEPGRRSRVLQRVARVSSPGRGKPTAKEYAERLMTQPWWPHVRDLVVALRQTWWVLRAWVVFELAADVLTMNGPRFLPDTALGWTLLLGLVLASVHFGHTSSGKLSWRGRLLLVVNVAAVVLLPVAFAQASAPAYYENASGFLAPGLYLDGQPVTNLFPYGPDGRPITGVQLFDATGRPVAVTEHSDWTAQVPRALVPYVDSNGRQQWNTFPLYVARFNHGSDTWRPATVRAPSLPFLAAPVVSAPTVSADDGSERGAPATPPPDATASPTTSPTTSSATTTTPTPTSPAPGVPTSIPTDTAPSPPAG